MYIYWINLYAILTEIFGLDLTRKKNHYFTVYILNFIESRKSMGELYVDGGTSRY
jgi:hypothetical protein